MVAREELNKHQLTTLTTTIMKNFQTDELGMLTLMNTDSLACGILSLVVPEQKKCNLKLLLKYILRQFNSEDVEGTNDEGSS